MVESQLTLSPEEHQYLLGLLEETLKVRRVEEHRTRTPLYREHVVHHGDLIEGLLQKPRQPPG